MFVKFERQESALIVQFECDDDEPVRAYPAMASNSFTIGLDHPSTYDHIHPDHLALIAILVARPWMNSTLRLSHPISTVMSAAFAANNIEAGPVDEKLGPYNPEVVGYMGLAYSGGADSTAALSVLPPTTIPVFLDRPSSERSLYVKDMALQSCDRLRDIGYHVIVSSCDLEHVRQPIGFPTDLANGAPAIAHAAKLNLSSISYGTVFESLYGLGRTKFKDYELTSHKKKWWMLFESAGLPLSFPVGGVSEVGTELICEQSPFKSLARSCIRGTIDSPCNRCWKCFRKSTLKQALGLRNQEPEVLALLLSAREVKTKLSALPISHENVLLYNFARLDLSMYPPSFKDRFSFQHDLEYLERWYSPSLAYVHTPFRDGVQARILEYLRIMSASDEGEVKTWDIQDRTAAISPLKYDL